MSLFLRSFPRSGALLLILLALGAQAAPAPPPAASPAEERHALRVFDRFLDHHPFLEDELRLHPELRLDPHYLAENRELRDLLAATPQLEAALRSHPCYLLARALLREAHGPLKTSDLTRLVELLEHEPPAARELAATPATIRDPAFLAKHPNLRELLKSTPRLARAYLPPP